jgi:hypothetical protein
MARYYQGRAPVGGWAPPATLVAATVDPATGFRATGNCPPESLREEFFLPGTEPHDYCPLHPESGVERFLGKVWQKVRGIF